MRHGGRGGRKQEKVQRFELEEQGGADQHHMTEQVNCETWTKAENT